MGLHAQYSRLTALLNLAAVSERLTLARPMAESQTGMFRNYALGIGPDLEFAGTGEPTIQGRSEQYVVM